MVTIVGGPHRAVLTEFKGPTDSKGARIIAKVAGSGKRFTIPWDHALDVTGNHDAAARVVCERMEWSGSLRGASIDGGGYVYLLVPTARKH